MTDHELLLSLSEMMDSKLEPLKRELQNSRLLLENDILPRLQNIEACYTSTYRRYRSGIDEMEVLKSDMELVKKVISEHSVKLQSIGSV